MSSSSASVLLVDLPTLLVVPSALSHDRSDDLQLCNLVYSCFPHLQPSCALAATRSLVKSALHALQAWWNSETIGEYWTLWNMPVHHWMLRHVYVPIRTTSGSRNAGIFASFFLSAVFHEILIAVPLHRVKGYAFFGMLGQVRGQHHSA